MLDSYFLPAFSKQIAPSLLFLSPVLANSYSPPRGSGTVRHMAAPPPEPRLTSEQRRALAFVASFPHGIFEDLFNRATIAGLVEAGLAMARPEIITGPGGATIDAVRITITDAGRRAP